MKTTIIKAIATVLLISAGMYGIHAFAFGSINFNNWSCEGRIILIVVFVFSVIYAAADISASAEVRKLTKK